LRLAVNAEELRCDRAVHGFGKREDLAQLAAHHLRLLGMELGLDAFRHDPDVELPTDGDQPSHDHRARIAGRQPRDERLVDLDDDDRHVEEVGERRVTGPEIVERDADNCVLKILSD
jgi:hypothetical protein